MNIHRLFVRRNSHLSFRSFFQMQGRGKPRRRFVVFIVFAFPSLRRRRRGGGVFRHLRRPSKRFLQLAASSLLPDVNPNDQAALPSCVVGLAWCRLIKRRPFVCGSFDRMKNRIIYKIILWVVFGRLTTHRGRTQDRFWRFFDEKKYFSFQNLWVVVVMSLCCV